MNDNTKTLVFIGIAAVAGLLAFVSRPSPAEPVDDDPRGELLFDEFSVDDVAELQIVKYESKNLNLQTLLTEGKLKPTSLVVKRDGDTWVLPSHDDYGVDAEAKSQLPLRHSWGWKSTALLPITLPTMKTTASWSQMSIALISRPQAWELSFD